METLAACPHCRTVMLPGQTECLSCGRQAQAVPAETKHTHVPDEAVAFCPFCARGGEPSAAPQPTLWLDAKPDRRVLRALVLIGGGLLLAVGVMFGVRSLFFTPENAINDHFAALARRDPAAALDTLDTRGRRQMSGLPLAREGALRSPDYRPPADVRVDRVETYDDAFARSDSTNMVRATVHFRVGAHRQNAVIFLVRDKKSSWLFFHRWRLLNAAGSVAADVASSSGVMVAGQPIAKGQEDDGIESPAFAGEYTVRLPGNPLLESAPGSVLVSYGYESPAVARLQPTLRPLAQDGAAAMVHAYLDACAKSTDAAPEGCPLSSGHYDASNVSWTIDAYPQVTVEMVDGVPTVSTNTLGSATVSGNDGDLYGETSHFSEKTDVSVTGSLVLVDGGKISFRPGAG
jgi:hypothetical protein